MIANVRELEEAIKKVERLGVEFDRMREFGNRGESVFQAYLGVDDGAISIAVFVNKYDDKGMIMGNYGEFKCLINEGFDTPFEEFLMAAKDELRRLGGLWALNPID